MSVKRCSVHDVSYDGGSCPLCSSRAPTTAVAIKADSGKAPLSLIPTEYLLGTAAVFGFGAIKYGRHNFRNGLAHSRSLDAALRHILAILSGEEKDSESGLPHVYHASCSLAMYDYSRIYHPEVNDLYSKESK